MSAISSHALSEAETDRPAVPGQLVKASLRLNIGGHSTSGAKARNDDAFAAHIPKSKYARQMKGAVACIADGISVSDKSHLASQMSVTQFIDDYFATPESWSVETSASRVLRALNDWLYSQSRHNQTSAMVTTFSAAVLKSNSLHIFHVGDSRIYRIRDNSIEPLTRDHSVNLTRSDSVLTASLGMDARLSVDYSRLDMAVDDLLVLLTDGILESLRPSAILSHIKGAQSKGNSLDTIAKDLCQLAQAQGSKDNLTCGLVAVHSLPVENLNEAHQRVTSRKIPPVLSVGHTLDGYRVLDIIHAGTRSHIYKVKQIKTGDNFIVKTPSLNFADDEAYLDGFIREQWVGRRLEHPGLMRSYPALEDSPFLYLVSEYIAGQTLRSWILDNPNPALSQVRDIMRQLIMALRKMHRMGMIHRDLKPENIMITPQGDIKIIDFGTVSVAGLKDAASPIGQDHSLGAVNYSAPECVMGQRATAQSDIFSLGIIAYELIAGKRPYKDIASNRSRQTSFGDWSYRRADGLVPDWVDFALEKACAPNPAKRYPVMSEFNEDLARPGRFPKSNKNATALIERNPIAFWKGLSLLSMGIALILFILLMQATA